MSVSHTVAHDQHAVVDCCGGLSNVDYNKVQYIIIIIINIIINMQYRWEVHHNKVQYLY